MSYIKPSDTVVYVRQASDLSGTLDSTKLYVIDGIIDMGSQTIEVPAGGLNLHGHTFDISGLTSSEAAYTMFTSPVGGSGNVLGVDFLISVTGAGSQVFDIQDADATHAVEFQRVNYNSCTSLGEVDNYRQWLEEGTGRFGGQPSVTFTGAWSGGCLIVTSIVRGIDNAMTEPLFKAGTGFVMQSRFRTNMNVDLGTLAPLLDFSPSNLPNAGTLQLRECIVSRNGVFSPDDSTLLPNITEAATASKFDGNAGLRNTYVGGKQDLTTEITTSITSSSTFFALAGTWTASDLQHFDVPANGQLRHIGISPIEYVFVGDLIIDGGPNDEIEVRLRRFNSGSATTETVGSQTRQINNLQGGRDVAFFSLNIPVTLLNGDYVFLEVANNTDTTNITLDTGSCARIGSR